VAGDRAERAGGELDLHLLPAWLLAARKPPKLRPVLATLGPLDLPDVRPSVAGPAPAG
jgi:hypothetical protein